MEKSVIVLQVENVLRMLKAVRGGVVFGSVFSPELELTEIKEKISLVKQLMYEAGERGVKLPQGFLNELRYIIFDLEDILDIIALQKHMEVSADGKFLSQVRYFFKPITQLSSNFTISQQFKEIAGRIDDIIASGRELSISGALNMLSGNKLADENIPFLESDTIIGRADDKSAIIKMLLSDGKSDSKNISFVSIVGIGGIGKTTLAKLVYADKSIEEVFELRMWVGISHSETFNLKSIIYKLLKSATTESVPGYLGLTELKTQLRKAISNKTFLLVLDDVWTEDTLWWFMLKDVLIKGGGAKGSKILVTTRSKRVAKATGNALVHELQGLSDADSWNLFVRVAFGETKEKINDKLVHIGEQIIKKCANVPLAIKVIGSHLYGQDIDKWVVFEHTDLASIEYVNSTIFRVLKLSYDELSSPLKCCFSYCALFPKDYPIEKQELIALWMAQGFIYPLDCFQSLEDVAEEYFSILLHRSFFKDVRMDSYGGVLSFKIHGLMHDLAGSMAQKEISVESSDSKPSGNKVRHLSVSEVRGDSFPNTCLPRFKGLHTFLSFSCPKDIQQLTISSIFCLKSLRVFTLCYSDIRCLPNVIADLCHLRYIDLSFNSKLESLPKTLTKLYNLQVLSLRGCSRITELPSDLGRLVNLRHLDISGCNGLAYMPLGMKNLTSLCTLPMFVVGETSYACSSKSLDELRSLTKLRKKLTVRFLRGSGCHVGKSGEVGYLRDKDHLTGISIQWSKSEGFQLMNYKNCEALLECLEPHPNVNYLDLKGFTGMRFPSWASMKNPALPSSNLAHICLEECPRLQHIPILSKLPRLKILKLYKLEDLEYVESNILDFVASHPESRLVESQIFFPSLEFLTLDNLPKLKGWRRSTDEEHRTIICRQQIDDSCGVPVFPCLRQLRVTECAKLTTLPLCPNLKELEVYRFNKSLQLLINNKSLKQHLSVLRRVTIDDVGYFDYLPVESYEHISCLIIHLSDLECLSTTNEVFNSDMIYLQSVQIRLCSKLKSISGLGWKHLAALHSLTLSNLPNACLITKEAEGEDNAMPWKSLKNLCYLELDYLPKLVELPKGIQNLTSLCTFEIRSCHNLEEVPEWIGYLKTLQSLCIEACIGLKSLPESLKLSSLRRLEIKRCLGFE